MIPLTLTIPERIRGGYDDTLYKSTFTLLYFTLLTSLRSLVVDQESMRLMGVFPWLGQCFEFPLVLDRKAVGKLCHLSQRFCFRISGGRISRGTG